MPLFPRHFEKLMLMSSEAVKAQSSFATTIIRAIREIMQNACRFTRPGCATGTWPPRRGNANDNSTRGLNFPLLFLCPLDCRASTHVKIECTICVYMCVYVHAHFRSDNIVI